MDIIKGSALKRPAHNLVSIGPAIERQKKAVQEAKELYFNSQRSGNMYNQYKYRVRVLNELLRIEQELKLNSVRHMKEFNLNKGIGDASDFEDYSNQIFEEYLEGFSKENGLLRDLEEDDPFSEDECAFMYTDRGQRLALKMKGLLERVGAAHFPGEDIYISSSLFMEN